MINRVGNREGYDYPVVNERKLNNEAGNVTEKFRLDYSKEGALYEPSKEAVNLQKEDIGVKLTLSGEKKEETENTKEDKTSALNDGKSIFDMAKATIQKIIGTIKGVLLNIWREDETPEVEQSILNPQDLDTFKPQNRFEQAKAEAEQFLASEQGKLAVKNSDLLTRYDRHATVVHLSPSDRQRILYGDKNQLDV